MTDQERKAMELAVVALEYHQEQTRPIHKTQETVAALRQALAQDEQEPVAWMHPDGKNYKGFKSPLTTFMVNGWTPLYTAPPSKPWVSLTDEEINQAANNAGFGHINIAREIEAKLKERNHD